MEEIMLLTDSNYCRLCGESNEYGVDLFELDENSTNLQQLINKYLPLVIEQDEKFPKHICPGCHIQMEATKLFLDLIIEGQSKLREIYRKQQELLQKQVNVEVYTCIGGTVYTEDHTLRLDVEGLEKPKRKRGRPKKIIPEEQIIEEEKPEDSNQQKVEDIEEIDSDGRRKRRVKAPARYQGTVQGKELEDILKKEGVIDEERKVVETTIRKETAREIIIGRTEGEHGEDLGKPVFINKAKNKFKTAVTLKKFELGNYECGTCSKKFIQKLHFELHLKTHENEGLDQSVLRLEPDEPNNVEPQRSILTSDDNSVNVSDSSQMKNVSSQCIKDNNMCHKCNKNFPSPVDLKIHSGEHADTRQFTCEMCGKVLHHSSSLIYHKESEHTTKRFVCNTCNKSFKHRQLLQRHQLVHSNDRPFHCPICEASFKTSTNLLNHEAVHTGDKKFECIECNQKFAHRTSLSQHQRWHEGKKPYTCEFCQKSFSQNGNLLEHKRIHTGEKPFFCAVCGKNFTTSSQLKIHMKIHTGEKPWKCDVCDKSFLHKVTYTFHLRRHFDEPPYACDICNRSFTEPWGLKKHMRIHTGEKPFKCDHCSKAFSDKSNRERHMRTHKLSSTSNGDGKKDSSSFHLAQLVDPHGNPISITTQDGQTIPVVTSGDDDSNLQGLIPDGTLVPIEITTVPAKYLEEEMSQDNVLNFFDTNSSTVAIQKALDQKDIQEMNPNFQLLTNNNVGVCLVTYTIEENGAL